VPALAEQGEAGNSWIFVYKKMIKNKYTKIILNAATGISIEILYAFAIMVMAFLICFILV